MPAPKKPRAASVSASSAKASKPELKPLDTYLAALLNPALNRNRPPPIAPEPEKPRPGKPKGRATKEPISKAATRKVEIGRASCRERVSIAV